MNKIDDRFNILLVPLLIAFFVWLVFHEFSQKNTKQVTPFRLQEPLEMIYTKRGDICYRDTGPIGLSSSISCINKND